MLKTARPLLPTAQIYSKPVLLQCCSAVNRFPVPPVSGGELGTKYVQRRVRTVALTGFNQHEMGAANAHHVRRMKDSARGGLQWGLIERLFFEHLS